VSFFYRHYKWFVSFSLVAARLEHVFLGEQLLVFVSLRLVFLLELNVRHLFRH
jgi:hypothetical protein